MTRSALLRRVLPQPSHPTTLNESNRNDHDREHQQGVNQAAHGVRGHKTQKPEDDQDDCKCFEHFRSPFAMIGRNSDPAAHCGRMNDKHSHLRLSSVHDGLAGDFGDKARLGTAAGLCAGERFVRCRLTAVKTNMAID
jgi:hypothetical protein